MLRVTVARNDWKTKSMVIEGDREDFDRISDKFHRLQRNELIKWYQVELLKEEEKEDEENEDTTSDKSYKERVEAIENNKTWPAGDYYYEDEICTISYKTDESGRTVQLMDGKYMGENFVSTLKDDVWSGKYASWTDEDILPVVVTDNPEEAVEKAFGKPSDYGFERVQEDSVKVGDEILIQQGCFVNSMTVIDKTKNASLYILRPTSRVEKNDSSEDMFVDSDYIKRNRLKNIGR